VEARTGYVAAGNAQLHFRDIGVGPSIVVLHGGPDFDYDYLLPNSTVWPSGSGSSTTTSAVAGDQLTA
jgi:hypothetical protein